MSAGRTSATTKKNLERTTMNHEARRTTNEEVTSTALLGTLYAAVLVM